MSFGQIKSTLDSVEKLLKKLREKFSVLSVL